MGLINVLDCQTANLITAGEVLERPASAVKEMLENSADAGATKVTVEIKGGGKTYIRVSDNGHGMSREDVSKCILRHATSKIKSGADLEEIQTFGFRGEALAAIASVSKIRILTKCESEEIGTLLECDFGENVRISDAGCPNGTTITVEMIFSNVPSRRKYLRRDVTEALYVQTECQRFALSRCDIELTLINENNLKIQAPGDGNLKGAIYACLGREFCATLIPVEYEMQNIRIHGFISKPEYTRPNRNMQHFFINRRYVNTRTMMIATEEATRNFCPTGKYPGCVLFCDINPSLVDVNVHPAKLYIRLAEDKWVFDAVYFAVRSTYSRSATADVFSCDDETVNYTPFSNESVKDKPTTSFSAPFATKSSTEKATTSENSVTLLNTQIKKSEDITQEETKKIDVLKQEPKTPNVQTRILNEDFSQNGKEKNEKAKELDFLSDVYEKSPSPATTQTKSVSDDFLVAEKTQNISVLKPFEQKEKTESKNIPPFSSPVIKEKQESLITADQVAKPIYVGEVFDTYIIAQYKSSMYIIDKHAAHERIIYERLKNPNHENSAQYLLESVSVKLTPKEALAAHTNRQYFEKIGFDFDDFGDSTVIIRSIPQPISQSDTASVFTFLAGKLSEGNNKSAGEIFDRALYTAACRAAIKGGDKHTDFDNKYIIDQIFCNEAIIYCPHGRPVIHEFSKTKLDKMFSRT